jgi:hypothetical protein
MRSYDLHDGIGVLIRKGRETRVESDSLSPSCEDI